MKEKSVPLIYGSDAAWKHRHDGKTVEIDVVRFDYDLLSTPKVLDMVVLKVLPTEYHLDRDGPDVFEGLIGNPIALTIQLSHDSLVSMVDVLL